MLVIQITHGRLNPRGGATDVEGNDVDDWGFDGPLLVKCTGVTWIYGELHFCFEDEPAARVAQLLTGWELGNDVDQLTPEFSEGCIKLRNAERERFEYFGDWDLFQAPTIAVQLPADRIDLLFNEPIVAVQRRIDDEAFGITAPLRTGPASFSFSPEEFRRLHVGVDVSSDVPRAPIPVVAVSGFAAWSSRSRK